MKKIVLYFHGGSKNHGCEAIIRSTAKILGDNLTVYSTHPEEDYQYLLDKVVSIKSDSANRLSLLEKIKVAVLYKLFRSDYAYVTLTHKNFIKDIKKGDIYLSVGGDNYCYDGREILGFYNKIIHKKGAKTVLWGCSFDPADLTIEIEKDLARYDLIVARESISYNVLKKINSNTVLLPDPAFQLDCEYIELPRGFCKNQTIGINLSPLVSKYANGNMIFQNYVNLVRWILDNTNYNIALIPHVVTDGSNDRTILLKLYKMFEKTNRVLDISDFNCMQLKSLISQCNYFIGARTHATIAAYSTGVPTLVVGYSVKAKGIARELFGTDENYVLPVQSLKNENDLIDAFIWLMNNEHSIRDRLNKMMPEYREKILNARALIDKL